MSQKVRFTPYGITFESFARGTQSLISATGIPYVEEFSNVMFKPTPSGAPKRPLRPALKTFPSTTSLSNYSNLSSNTKLFPVAPEALAPLDDFAGTPPQLNVRSPVLEPSSRLSRAIFDGTPSGGLYIHFPSHAAGTHIPSEPKKTSSSRLRRLRKTISDAVREAGMDSPPSPIVDSRAAPPAPSIRASVADALARGSQRAQKPQGLRIDVGRRTVTAANPAASTRQKRGSLYRGTYGQVCAALRAAGLDMTPCSDVGFGEGRLL
jgi:hypothetical protein